MLNLDLFDKNNFRIKEISKFFLNENYIVKTYNDINKILIEPENFKLIIINDSKVYLNYKETLFNFAKKEQLIIIIEKKLKPEIEELIKNNIKNHIYLPINSIKDLGIYISEIIDKTSLVSDKKNLLSLLLDEFNIFLNKCNCEETHNVDKLKNKIHILNKLIKQYTKTRHMFSGSISESPVFELLKFIQMFFNTGIIKIESNTVKGTIAINNNTIINVTSNIFSNSLKSFDLLSSLNNGTFVFSEHLIDTTNKDFSSFNFNNLIQRAYNNYKWFKVNKAILPKEDISLKINQKKLFSHKINQFEFEVLADIVKNSLIKNILALNSLNLVDTYETLINLRRKGILEVLKK